MPRGCRAMTPSGQASPSLISDLGVKGVDLPIPRCWQLREARITYVRAVNDNPGQCGQPGKLCEPLLRDRGSAHVQRLKVVEIRQPRESFVRHIRAAQRKRMRHRLLWSRWPGP